MNQDAPIIEQPFIAEDSHTEFAAGDLVLVVNDKWRDMTRVIRDFDLREVYALYRQESGQTSAVDFYDYLGGQGFIEQVEAKEMHIDSAAYSDGVTAYSKVE
jgi:hypothetical protein